MRVYQPVHVTRSNGRSCSGLILMVWCESTSLYTVHVATVDLVFRSNIDGLMRAYQPADGTRSNGQQRSLLPQGKNKLIITLEFVFFRWIKWETALFITVLIIFYYRWQFICNIHLYLRKREEEGRYQVLFVLLGGGWDQGRVQHRGVQAAEGQPEVLQSRWAER